MSQHHIILMDVLHSLNASQLVDMLWQSTGTTDDTLQARPWSHSACHRQAYFAYYRRQWGYYTLPHSRLHVALNTASDMNEFVHHLSTMGPTNKMEVISYLEEWRGTSLSNEVLEHTINLAVSVWLMTKLGPVSEQEGRWRRLRWREGSLQDCIHEHFNKKPALSFDGIRLPRSFDAWSIEKIGGIKIEFTDSLDDHLFLSDDKSGMKVQVFHHADFLQHFQSPMFPEGLLSETLDTLKLVFPQSEFGRLKGYKGKRRKFLESLWFKSREREIDTKLGSCGTLQAEARRIERFNFWRDRLIVLKQAYDEKTPSSIPQWWHDRRNRVVWSTFWIAILVLVLSVAFGIVQCVQGGIQASKA